jgi:hypothetical protein
MSPGPTLGEALRKAETAWIAAGFPAEKDKLETIVRAAAGR